jgi:hypothetical protein
MFHLVLMLALAAEAPAPAPAPPPAPPPPAASAPASASGAIPFRTESSPRVDAVFGDIAAFRVSIDRFLSLQGEMDRIHDDFATAVHETLVALAGPSGPFPASATTASANPNTTRVCPAGTAAPYMRALSSGGRYLALGQQLQATYREIRRGDDLGDTMGLTPDYRWKVKKAKDLHQQLLSDYREMHVAFYDQLGAEMRHAGCPVGPRAVAATDDAGAAAKPSDGAAAPAEAPAQAAAATPADGRPNPSDPGSWVIDDAASDGESSAPSSTPAALQSTAPRAPAGAQAAAPAAPTAPADPRPVPSDGMPSSPAPSVWIEVDNSLCAQTTRLSIDGQPQGEIGGRKRMSVRARSGPHELCALPASDPRACGDAGTVRKAYLHEGWSLTIHCGK